MQLLLIGSEMVGEDYSMVNVTRLTFDIEEIVDRKKQQAAYEKAAESIRAKLCLITEQRDAIKKWLLDSVPGDTLLIEKKTDYSEAHDEYVLVMCDPDHHPELTRLIVDKKEVVETVATLFPIPRTKVTKTSARKK